MKKTATTLRLLILSFLAMIVCATAFAFIGINYGEKLTAHAAAATTGAPQYKATSTVLTSVGELGVTAEGYRIIYDLDYFNISYSGTGKSVVTLNGLNEKGYKALDTKTYTPSAIEVPFVVQVPEGVTDVGGNSFDFCTALHGVYFPDSVINIGNWAFRKCTFTEVELPANLQTMLGQAFAISDLEKVTLRKSASVPNPTFVSVDSEIDGEVHEGSAVVRVANKYLTIGTKWTDLAALADGVTVDGITVQVTRLNDRAFIYRKMDSLTIPKKITAFGNSPLLWSIIKEIKVEEGHTAFKVVDNCLLNLSGSIVYYCANENAVIPDNVITLQTGVVRNDCKSISIPDTVTNVSGNLAIEEIKYIEMRGEGKNDVYYVEGNCLLEYEKDERGVKTGRAGVKWGSVNSQIPEDEGVFQIGQGAFESLKALETINIPENITVIGNNAFQNTSLKSITVGNNLQSVANAAFLSTPYYEDPTNWEGPAFYLDTMLLSISIAQNGVYTVREGTTAISAHIFENFAGLTKVIFPDSLKVIQDNAFLNCTSLNEVVFGSGIEKINNGAFQNCDSLKTITIPENVTTIGNYIFSQCDNISTVYVPKTLQTVGTIMFNKANANVRLVAEDYNSYQTLKDGALKSYATQLAYEVPVTFKVGANEFTQTKLANQPLSYVKSGNEWTKGAAFDLGISGVTSWTVDDENGATFNLATDLVPADGNELVLYANLAAGATGDIEINAPDLSAVNVELTYGNAIDFNPEAYGFIEGAMTVWYDGADNDGNSYSGTLVPQNAGTYTFEFRPEAGFAWVGGASNPQGQITVNPMVIEEVIWSYESTQYNGNVQKPVAKYYDPFIRQYIPLAVSLVAGYDGTNAGEQRVSATAEAGDINFTVDAATTKNATYIYNITRRIITLEAVDTEFDYDGSAKHEGVKFNIYAFNDGKIAYSVKIVDGEGNDVTEAKNAGTYHLVVTLTASATNYAFADDINYVEFIINPAEITFDATDKFVYDGSAKQDGVIYNVTYVDDGVIAYVIKYYDENGNEITEAINAGNYKAVIVLTASEGNYCFKDDTDYAEFIIDKAQATIVWENTRLLYTGSQLLPDAFYTYAGVGGVEVKLPLEVKLYKGFDGISVGIQRATVADAIALLKDNFTFVNAGTDANSAYEIYDIKNLTIFWGAETTFIYDENAHLPYAYYVLDGSSRKIMLDVALVIPDGETYTEAVEAGVYTASVKDALIALGYDPDDTTMVTGDVEMPFVIVAAIEEIVVVTWSGSEWIFTGEPLTPAVETEGYAISYAYFEENGSELKSAPVNAGKYTVRATLYKKDGKVAATSDYMFEIVKAKISKPVVGVSVFATYEEAKAYAPVGYDANTMEISGVNGDGIYTVIVALKDSENCEWVDGKTEDVTFALKISPEVKSTVITGDGVTYVTGEAMPKYMLYALLGGVAFVSLIALIVAISSRRKIVIKNSDNDGFYDDYEE